MLSAQNAQEITIAEQKWIDDKRAIWVNIGDYNVMSHIAKRHNFVYPEGHRDEGKMDTRKVVEYLIKNFQDKIA